MSRVSIWSYELPHTTEARSQDCCSSVTDTLPVHRYAYPAADSRNWSAATDNCCHRNFLLHSPSHTATGKFVHGAEERLQHTGNIPTAALYSRQHFQTPPYSNFNCGTVARTRRKLFQAKFAVVTLYKLCQQGTGVFQTAGQSLRMRRWMLYELASGYSVCFWRWGFFLYIW